MPKLLGTTFEDWAIGRVLDERKRQEQKWGHQYHEQAMWQLIQDEESGEVAQAILKIREATAKGDAAGAIHWRKELHKELVQNAAVALARLACAYEIGTVDHEIPEPFWKADDDKQI